MPVTFGSVGDIISVSLLAKDLIISLNESRGSAIEYQGVIRDLQNLDDLFLKVNKIFETSHTNLELAALHQTGRHIGEACGHCLATFKERVSRYDKSLGRRDGGRLQSAFAKVRWHVGEKDSLAKFRVEIAGYVASLNMLLNMTNW